MNFDEISKLNNDTPEVLVEKIKKGDIDLDDLNNWIYEFSRSSEVSYKVRVAYLYHPNLTLIDFKKYYHKFNISNDSVYSEAPVFSSLEVIAFILGCDDASTESIKKGITRSPNTKFTTSVLLTNPFVTYEFRMIVFDVTGNTKLLPSNIQSIFVF
jgi:hypothetical protein